MRIHFNCAIVDGYLDYMWCHFDELEDKDKLYDCYTIPSLIKKKCCSCTAPAFTNIARMLWRNLLFPQKSGQNQQSMGSEVLHITHEDRENLTNACYSSKNAGSKSFLAHVNVQLKNVWLPVWLSSLQVWSGCVHSTLGPTGFCRIQLKDLKHFLKATLLNTVLQRQFYIHSYIIDLPEGAFWEILSYLNAATCAQKVFRYNCVAYIEVYPHLYPESDEKFCIHYNQTETVSERVGPSKEQHPPVKLSWLCV